MEAPVNLDAFANLPQQGSAPMRSPSRTLAALERAATRDALLECGLLSINQP